MTDPRLLLAIPVLPVLSIERALDFYEGKLGFSRHIDSTEYAGVERDGIQIHFWRCDDEGLPPRSSCRVNVVGVDALFERCLRAGVVVETQLPEKKSWGFREFTVVDPDGNQVSFAEEIPDWVEE